MKTEASRGGSSSLSVDGVVDTDDVGLARARFLHRQLEHRQRALQEGHSDL